MVKRRSWMDEYKVRVCPRCKRSLMRKDFGHSTVTQDHKQLHCKECVKAIKVAQKGASYRATVEGRITTIMHGLGRRTKQAKGRMDLTRAELKLLLRKRKCAYCGCAMSRNDLRTKPTIEHIKPLAQGGHTVLSNLITVCWQCNHDKGDKTLEQWTNRWYEQE